MAARPKLQQLVAAREELAAARRTLDATRAAQAAPRALKLNMDLVAIALVLGVLACLMAPISTAPATFVDSGNILAIARPVLDGNFGPLVQTQSPPVQSALYAAAMGAGSWFPLQVIPVAFSFALAAFLVGLAYRETRNAALAILPALFIGVSRVFWLQTGSLALYPAFILFGYCGLWFAGRFVIRENEDTSSGLLGAGLLAASLYTFGQAAPYMAVPLLFLVLAPNRRAVDRLVRLYAVLAALLLPWVIWHLAVGGLAHFYYYPHSWLATEYQPFINEFWGRNYGLGLGYVLDMGAVAFKMLPWWVWLLSPLGLVYVERTYGRRAVLFVLGMLAILSLPIFITRPTGLARYWYSTLPVFVMLASAGAVLILSSIRNAQLATMAVVVAAACCLIVASGEARGAYDKHVVDVEHAAYYAEFEAMATVIDDDRGIIGRDAKMQTLVRNNQMYNNILMEESDFVTYLSWPSDAAVMRVFAKYDIGWVLIYKDLRWERDYNVWLEWAYGVQPSHFSKIARSPYFGLAYEGDAYQLYRFNPPADAFSGALFERALKRSFSR